VETSPEVFEDVVVAQTDNTYDEAGEGISFARLGRLHDATGEGALSVGTNPQTRLAYTSIYPDGIGRTHPVAEYGAIDDYSRSGTIPSRSNNILVTTTTYDDAGMLSDTLDPKGFTSVVGYDDAGRKTVTIQDLSGLEIEVDYTYTLDNQVETM